MAGQDKSKVSSIINETLTNPCSTGATDLFAEAPVNGSAPQLNTNKLDNDLMGHAYALINFAKNEGIEPTELLAKILASGRLMLAENKPHTPELSQNPSPSSDRALYTKDPTELTCFDDYLEELVY